MKRTWLVFGAAVAVAFLAGVWSGRHLAADGLESDDDDVGAIGSRSGSAALGARGPAAHGSRAPSALSIRGSVEGATGGPGAVRLADRVEAILDDGHYLRRHGAFEALLAEMKPEDGPELVELIRAWDRRGIGHGREWEILWTRWGEVDGEGAFRYLVETAGDWHPAARGGAAFQAMRTWAATDPAEALTFLQTPDSEGLDPHLRKALVEGWSWTDREGATDYVLGLGEDDRERGVFLDLLVTAAAREGGQAQVLEWFARLDGSPGGENARSLIGPNVFQRLWAGDREDALGWVADGVDAEWMSPGVVIEAVRLQAEQSGTKQALEWFDTLPPGNTSVAAGADVLMRVLAGQDADAVGAWLAGQTARDDYDALVTAGIQGVLANDPPQAAVWAQTIRDEATRERMLDRIVRTVERGGR